MYVFRSPSPPPRLSTPLFTERNTSQEPNTTTSKQDSNNWNKQYPHYSVHQRLLRLLLPSRLLLQPLQIQGTCLLSITRCLCRGVWVVWVEGGVGVLRIIHSLISRAGCTLCYPPGLSSSLHNHSNSIINTIIGITPVLTPLGPLPPLDTCQCNSSSSSIPQLRPQ